MQHEPQEWGRPRRDHLLPAKTTQKLDDSFINRTQYALQSAAKYSLPFWYRQPIVTGTSVVAVKYAEGVIMATDCLASYGSLARFRDMKRMVNLGDKTLLGTSGDMSDFQHITRLLHQYHVTEQCHDDGHSMTPRQWFTALAAILYKRRTDGNPLWTGNVLAGFEPQSGELFLGSCDLLGTQFESDSIATGFGSHLAQPLLREALDQAKAREQPLSEAEAVALIERCMRVLYYRDARSLDKIQIAKVTRAGVTISEPYIIDSDWSIA